jgi:NADH-quinone oxidoreductase subunit L
MTMATFAISGFPPFAGFFSKDAILWRAYSSPYGSWVYWVIGLFTAFLTAFYMFRLWFLTFFGKYRGAAEEVHGHAEHAGHGAHLGREEHGHGGIHESPAIMLAPLVILAVLSVAGGWIGWPTALGGSNYFDKFLEPALHVTAPGASAGEVSESAQTQATEHSEQGGKEVIFSTISVVAAGFGLILAWLLYHRRPELPQRIADRLDGFYHAVVNKYYVDEFYAAIFVKPLIAGSTRILWQGVDQGVIDTTINSGADGAREVSDAARHMQSGNLRSYAGWIAAGAAIVIGYMTWMGTR